MADEVGTHWAECWRAHLDCAIAYVERLKDDISACNVEIEELEAEKQLLRRQGLREMTARADYSRDRLPEDGGES